MNRRVLLLLIVLVALAAVVVIFVLPLLNSAPTNPGQQGAPVGTPIPSPTPVVTTPVVVAIQDLPRGIRIPESALQIRAWPNNPSPDQPSSVPPDAVPDIAKVAGQIARTDIYAGEPVTAHMIVPDLQALAAQGSDAAAITPKGKVLVSIPVDKLSDVGYSVQDGDYVDVIVSFLFVNVDPRFQTITPDKSTILTIKPDGTISTTTGQAGEVSPSAIALPAGSFLILGPNEAQRPRLATQRTIQGAWVVHVGTFPPNGQFLRTMPATPTPLPTAAEAGQKGSPPPPTPTPPYPDIVTLAVTPQDAVTLTWIIEANIPMSLSLRSVQDKDVPSNPTNSVSLQYMLQTYNVTQPPELPYALEPALRSIRNLQGGGQINFNGSSGTGSGQ
ncbi:MAG TPA: SAF domain-containing protein [Aggregatilineales bacterium]|nr:SAF domain-containing protein [Aggregatilineales bacterium]